MFLHVVYELCVNGRRRGSRLAIERVQGAPENEALGGGRGMMTWNS